MFEEIQTIITLANYLEATPQQIIITSKDSEGWVILKDLRRKLKVRIPDFEKKYYPKVFFRLFEKPFLLENTELRCKANKSQPYAKPLKYTEKVRGGKKPRKGSARRLLRSIKTWRKAALYVNKHDQRFLYTYLASDYSTHFKAAQRELLSFYGLINSWSEQESTQLNPSPEELALTAINYKRFFIAYLRNKESLEQEVKSFLEEAENNGFSPRVAMKAYYLSESLNLILDKQKPLSYWFQQLGKLELEITSESLDKYEEYKEENTTK